MSGFAVDRMMGLKVPPRTGKPFELAFALSLGSDSLEGGLLRDGQGRVRLDLHLPLRTSILYCHSERRLVVLHHGLKAFEEEPLNTSPDYWADPLSRHGPALGRQAFGPIECSIHGNRDSDHGRCWYAPELGFAIKEHFNQGGQAFRMTPLQVRLGEPSCDAPFEIPRGYRLLQTQPR